jgi:hypothetical protein
VEVAYDLMLEEMVPQTQEAVEREYFMQMALLELADQE